jgi:hypothetical protein
MPLMLRKFYTGRNDNKNVIFTLSCLQKTLLGKEGSKRFPCIIFVVLKNKNKIFSSKTATKIAS